MMSKKTSRAVALLTGFAVATAWTGGMAGASAAPPQNNENRPADTEPARLVRAIYTNEFGVKRPTDLAWDASRKTLMVTGRERGGVTPLGSFTAAEQDRGKSVIDASVEPGTVAFDPRTGRVTALERGRRVALGGEGETQPHGWARQQTAGTLDGIAAGGTTYTSDGTMHVLDASTSTILSVAPTGSVEQTSIDGLDGVELRGLAYQPVEKQLYVAEADGDTLYALDAGGAVASTTDLSGAELSGVQAMTFAPSGDSTDAAEEQSLYVAGSGSTDRLGSVTELTFAPAVAPTSDGYVVTPAYVRSTATSSWVPPSSDPSGITHIPGKGLLVSDGEINELNGEPGEGDYYAGVNLWLANTDGTQVPGGTGDTTAFSNEPVGVEYANGRLYISDDTSPASVYEISDAGVDGMFATADDAAATTVFKTAGTGNTDPEGVAYDTKRDHILVIDGLNLELFRYTRAGVLVNQVDVEKAGMDDPEGIAYDAARDTVVVVDHIGIWELDERGSVLGRVDHATARIDKPAGVTVAPASSTPGAAFYVVDRGVDNDSDPFENDGVLFEIGAELPDVSNRPPAVSAGADQMVDLGDLAHLAGEAFDPEGATLTYSWSKQSGPGNVGFPGGETKLATTASFDMVGDYALRLTVKDGAAWTVTDDVVVSVHTVGAARTVRVPLSSGTDDARQGTQSGTATVNLGRAHNRLGEDVGTSGPYPVTIGLRFPGLPVPQDGQVVSAKIQFQTESHHAGAASLSIRGEAADDAAPFVAASNNITNRPPTAAKVSGWAPPEWRTTGVAGPDQLTPELAPILQEIVDRTGWKAGNAAVFVITGTGTRSAESYEGTPAGAPVLVVEYRMDKNQAPLVDAGADFTVKLPAQADLDGIVTDDGLPEPATVTTTWSRVSGPDAVQFTDPAMLDTTAAFSKEGNYVLRLTAKDGAGLEGADDVSVTVQAADSETTPPPSGGGGSTPPPSGGGGSTPPPSGGGGSAPPPTDSHDDSLAGYTVALQSGRATVLHGTAVQLSGAVADGGRAAPGVKVRVFVRRALRWQLVEMSSTVTGADGTYATEDLPMVTSRYYAVAGDKISDVVTVRVRPRLTARVAHPKVLAGTRTAIVGKVSPAVNGHVLRLQRWQVGEGWRTVARRSLTGGDMARYRFAVSSRASGVHRYRVVSPAQGGLAKAVAHGSDGKLVVRVYQATLVRIDGFRDLVVLRNGGTVGFSLAGWRLVERRTGARVVLPDFVVRPRAVVRIHSRAGAGNRRNVFLHTGEMWAIHGAVELRDARLRLADRLRY